MLERLPRQRPRAGIGVVRSVMVFINMPGRSRRCIQVQASEQDNGAAMSFHAVSPRCRISPRIFPAAA